MSSPDGSGGWGSGGWGPGGWGSNPYGSGQPVPNEQGPRTAYQGFGLFEPSRQAGGAQPGPYGRPPRRGRGLAIALVSLAVVLVLAGVTTAIVVNSGGSASQAAPPPPSATDSRTTGNSSTDNSNADNDPSTQQTFVAPVVAGWRGVSWTGYGVAYDVPQSWQPKPGTHIGVGDEATTSKNVTLSASSLYLENYCRQSGSSYRAVAGLTVLPDKDLATAANHLIDNWANYGFTSPSRVAPKVSKSTPQQVTLPDGRKAVLASATITPPPGVPCAASSEAISVVALPSADGSGSAMFMTLGDQGFPGAVSPADLRHIVTSLRRTK